MGGSQAIGDLPSKGTVGLWVPYSSACCWDRDASDFVPHCAPTMIYLYMCREIGLLILGWNLQNHKPH